MLFIFQVLIVWWQHTTTCGEGQQKWRIKCSDQHLHNQQLHNDINFIIKMLSNICSKGNDV